MTVVVSYNSDLEEGFASGHCSPGFGWEEFADRAMMIARLLVPAGMKVTIKLGSKSRIFFA
jgi:hypothetical protein